MTIVLFCAFLGENFYGTQKQPDRETVQGLFEKALSLIYDRPIRTTISSRLDGRVNALDFALSYEVERMPFSLDHLFYFLRRTLPRDIVLKGCKRAKDGFSARYDCKGKTYLYRIQNGEKNPLFNRFSYAPIRTLDEKVIERGGRLFVGTHDFRAFATPERKDENTVLTVDSFSMATEGGLLCLRFSGKSFLRYQVRFMVGALISLATGTVSFETIEALLRGEKVPYRKLKAEPQGLTLERLDYDPADFAEGR